MVFCREFHCQRVCAFFWANFFGLKVRSCLLLRFLHVWLHAKVAQGTHLFWSWRQCQWEIWCQRRSWRSPIAWRGHRWRRRWQRGGWLGWPPRVTACTGPNKTFELGQFWWQQCIAVPVHCNGKNRQISVIRGINVVGSLKTKRLLTF